MIKLTEYYTTEITNYRKKSWNKEIRRDTEVYLIKYYNKNYILETTEESKEGRQRIDFSYKILLNNNVIHSEYDVDGSLLKEKDVKSIIKSIKQKQKETKAKNKTWREELKIKKKRNELKAKSYGVHYNFFIQYQDMASEDTINLVLKTPEVKGYVWSKSPYSDSYYYHHKDNKIDWGYKPENSYRIADHWHWDGGEHCPVIENEYISNLELRIQQNGTYRKVA